MGICKRSDFTLRFPLEQAICVLAMGEAGGVAFIAVKSGKQATLDLIGSRELASGMRLRKGKYFDCFKHWGFDFFVCILITDVSSVI